MHFLRGRDADGRLRELAAARSAARPVLGALASELLRRKLFEALGYRCLGDYGRERLGVGARTLREWRRVWRALEALPVLRAAVLSGELSWSVARAVVGVVTPESQQSCLEGVRGRTLRAVEAIVAVVRQAQAEEGEEAKDRVLVRLRCTGEEALLWHAAVELARRVAGEEMPVWQCAEAIGAEFSSVAGCPQAGRAPDGRSASAGGRGPSAFGSAGRPEHGLRETAFPQLRWQRRPLVVPAPLAGMADDLAEASAREVDGRLRTAVAFLQGVDLEMGRLLREMVDRRLHREIGFQSVEHYAAERLDLSPRTARRLVALARAGHRAPAVARAFGEGTLTVFQAHSLTRVADRASAEA